MVRASLLGVAFYCGLASRLNGERGAGRAAAMGTAFHGTCEGKPDALDSLDESEQDEVRKWEKPTDIQVSPEVTLRYADAAKETPVAIDSRFRPLPYGHLFALTQGTADLHWLVGDCVYIADIKKSEFTVLEGPDSLQVMAYGMMLVAKYRKLGAKRFVPGLWHATEGTWAWLDRMIEEGSDEWKALKKRIRYAANNDGGEASTGAHCRQCWARTHCPEYLLPAALAEASPALKPFTDGGEPPTDEQALEALLVAQGMAELAKQVQDNVRAYVTAGGRVQQDNKRYLPVICKGRKSLNKKLLAEAVGSLSQFETKGAPYEQWKWVNAR